MSGIFQAFAFMRSSDVASSSAAFIASNSVSIYSWVVPTGVTNISVLAIGAGGNGQGNSTCGNFGGGGGALAYTNNISVTPGVSYNVYADSSSGSTMRFQGTGATVAAANGIQGSTGGSAAASTGTVKYSGGDGGYLNYGGGGAAGYAGNGGRAANTTSGNGLAGSGGGGGGGVRYSCLIYGVGVSNGGGGTGAKGQGSNGAGGVYNICGGSSTAGGTGSSASGTIPNATPSCYAPYPWSDNAGLGSSGIAQAVYPYAYGGRGAWYGGGGGGGTENNYCYGGCTIFVGGGGTGGAGIIRIIWPGNTRSYPSTNVGCP